jgi:F0F1-type ATP synthase assembly protein I
MERKIKKLKTRKETNRELMHYAGMGAQFLVSIGVGIFLGLKLDEWLNFSFPLLVWLLPLLIIGGLILKIIKDTSKK